MTQFKYEHRRFVEEKPVDLIQQLAMSVFVHKTVTDHYFTSDSSDLAVYVRDGESKIKAKGVQKSVDEIVDQVTDERSGQSSVTQDFLERHLGVKLSGSPDVQNFDAMKKALTANGAGYDKVNKEIWQYNVNGTEVEVTKANINGQDFWTVCVGAFSEDAIRQTFKKYDLKKIGVKAEYAEVLKALNKPQPLVMLGETPGKLGSKKYWAEVDSQRHEVTKSQYREMQASLLKQVEFRRSLA